MSHDRVDVSVPSATPVSSRLRVALHLGLAVSTLAFTGCRSQDPPVTETAFADSARIVIATTTGPDRALAWTFETDFILGGEASGPTSFNLLQPAAVTASNDGTILVLDRQARIVQRFTSDGAWLASVGKRGEGPGEIERPHSVAVMPDGRIAVYDFVKRKIVWLGDDSPSPSEAWARLQPPPNLQPHLAGSEAGLIANVIVRASTNPPSRSNDLLLLQAGDTTTLMTVVVPDFDLRAFQSCPGVSVRIPPVFWRSVVWGHKGNTTAVAVGPGYTVRLFRGSRPLRSVRRDLEVRRASVQDALQEVGDDFTLQVGPGTECTIPAAEIVEGSGFEATIPWISQIAVGPAEELWVRRKQVGSLVEGPIDVFSSDGSYVGTLPAETPFPVLFLPDGRIGVIERDSLDVDRLAIRRITR